MKPWARSSKSAPENKKLKVGDRVVVPFTISCGECFFCKRGFYSGCERTQSRSRDGGEALGPFPRRAVRLFASAGRLSRAVRQNICACPMPMSVRSRCRERALSDEQVLFLSDIFPTGYMAADFCDIKGGETIAIWGCGPVGQFAIRSAFLLGAERVIAIDTVPSGSRLRARAGAETIDFMKEDVYDRIQELTQGRGADACIDAVGTKPETDGQLRFHGGSRQGRGLHGHRPAARAAPGDPLLPQFRHGFDRRRLWRLPRQDPDGLRDQSRPDVPHGPDAGAALSAEAAGADREGRDRPVLRHHPPRARSRTGPELYKTFRDKKDGCIKVVLKP